MEPLSILGGRLLLTLPKATTIELDTGAEWRAQVDLDEPGVHLTIAAVEQLARAPSGFHAAVEGLLATERQLPLERLRSLRPLSVPSPLVAFLEPPQCVFVGRGSHFLLGAWIASDDATVQRITIHIRGNLDDAPYAPLARRILATIAPGARRSELHLTRTHALDPHLAISLPPGWLPAEQVGPDFVVHRFHRLAAIRDPAAWCGVYLGPEPYLRIDQERRTSPKKAPHVQVAPGTLLGDRVYWQHWSPDGTRHIAEALVRHPRRPQTSIHAWCSAPSVDHMPALGDVVGTLQISEPPPGRPPTRVRAARAP